MHKVGDMVQFKASWVESMRSGNYASTPTGPVRVVAFTTRFGGDNGGAIDVGPWNGIDQNWRWADHFEAVGGPW